MSIDADYVEKSVMDAIKNGSIDSNDIDFIKNFVDNVSNKMKGI